MDNKFYVSLEAAKLLKEKGYDTPTNSVYNLNLYEKDFIRQLYPKNWNEYEEPSIISAPTKAEAIDWLESKGVVVIVDISLSDKMWIYYIYKEGEHLHDSIISKEPQFQTRLEAEEAAIIKALNLV